MLIYPLVHSLFAQPNRSFIILPIMRFLNMIRIDNLDLTLAQALKWNPITQIQIYMRHWNKRLASLVFCKKLWHHSKCVTCVWRSSKLWWQIERLVKLVTCYTVYIGTGTRAYHFHWEILILDRVLLVPLSLHVSPLDLVKLFPIFAFCDATSQSFCIIHSFGWALHLEIILRSQRLENSMLNLFWVVSLWLIIRSS